MLRDPLAYLQRRCETGVWDRCQATDCSKVIPVSAPAGTKYCCSACGKRMWQARNRAQKQGSD